MRFGLEGGIAFIGQQTFVGQFQNTDLVGFGFSAEGDVAFDLAPNFGLGVRGGGVFAPASSSSSSVFTGYVGPELLFPYWHSGFMLGFGYTTNPDGPARTGLHLAIPYERKINATMKFGLTLGIGFYDGLVNQTLALQIGF